MNMKKEKTKNNVNNRLIIVTAVVMVVTLFISIVFIYVPFADKNKSLRKNILRERDKNVLVGKIKALGKYIDVYSKKIPESGGVSWLLGEVSDMASKERMEITSIKPGNPEDYGMYTKLFVIVDISSTYSLLRNFIFRVESSEKFLRIESVNMKRMDSDDEFRKDSKKLEAFDVRANVVISTIVSKE